MQRAIRTSANVYLPGSFPCKPSKKSHFVLPRQGNKICPFFENIHIRNGFWPCIYIYIFIYFFLAMLYMYQLFESKNRQPKATWLFFLQSPKRTKAQIRGAKPLRLRNMNRHLLPQQHQSHGRPPLFHRFHQRFHQRKVSLDF